jgi:hypothetical protein
MYIGSHVQPNNMRGSSSSRTTYLLRSHLQESLMDIWTYELSCGARMESVRHISPTYTQVGDTHFWQLLVVYATFSQLELNTTVYMMHTSALAVREARTSQYVTAVGSHNSDILTGKVLPKVLPSF